VSALSVLVFLLLWGSLSTADPQYPPNAVSGGTVVGMLQFVPGKETQVRILSGEEPFVSSSKDALAQWKIPPQQDSRELVVVQFRSPYMHVLRGSGGSTPGAAPSEESFPYPKFCPEPAYPANGFGQGSVILRAEIGVDGRVSGTPIVKSMGALTDAGIEAVKKWEFVPARDGKGAKVKSHAYIVLVFRFPLAGR
jgi:TonB family protein